MFDLFRFAFKRGYLPKDHDEMSAVELAENDGGEIEVFTPVELRKLFNACHTPVKERRKWRDRDTLAGRMPPNFSTRVMSLGNGCSEERLQRLRAWNADPAHKVLGGQFSFRRLSDAMLECSSLHEREKRRRRHERDRVP